MDEENENAPAQTQRYKWPWFVLAAVVLGIILAIIWVGLEARRVHEQRDPMRMQQN